MSTRYWLWPFLLVSSNAQAQNSAAYPEGEAMSQEIIVTATRTGETALQRTPIAVSVFSADRLESSLVANVKDLVSMTPSLNVSQSAGSAQLYIRGIGSNNTFIGSDPSVTVHSDGVYMARAFSQFTEFVDIDRIEVLRGPQGTLYGRNAVGGTINIISRVPSDDLEAKVRLVAGDYSHRQAQAYVSGPIVPGSVQASVSGHYTKHDPYVENIAPGGVDVADADNWGIRGQLRLTPTESIEAITRADYSTSREKVASAHLRAPVPGAVLANSVIGDFSRIATDHPAHQDKTLKGISQEINIELSKALSFKSLTAYRHSSDDLEGDADGTELPLVNSHMEATSKQFSQEFNLTANYDAFDGVLGIFYFNEDETSFQNLSLPTLIYQTIGKVSTNSIAVFAQGTYHLTDQWSVVAGARYTRDKKKVDLADSTQTHANYPNGPNVPGMPIRLISSETWNAFTPKLGVNFQFTPKILFYASVTDGFKSGGANYAALQLEGLMYDPEKLRSYEAGVKSDWLNGRLRVNITGFLYDYEDLQVQSLLSPGVTTIENAATARVRGAEIETSFMPLSGLRITANYALLDAEYDDFPDASVPTGLIPYLASSPSYNPTTGTYDAGGNTLNAAPSWSFNASAQYDFEIGGGTAFVRGDYFTQGRVYYDPSNVLVMSQGRYELVNAAIGFTNKRDKWSLELVAKNLTDEQYLFSLNSISAVPTGIAGAPRTFAVQVTKSW